MKTNFWKSAAAFVVGMAAMVACEKKPIEPEVVAPVFPSEVTEKNVEAGETVELQFAANLDWELSIPATEQNKYWLDDAGMPASKVSGKAGDQTVSVVFSEDEYYDANVLCEVTLTMGGESKVIAKLTRLAINRSLEVYVAETSEWGFKTTYGTEKAAALALTTFEGDVTYTLPIQVVANYDWSLALPEWCAGSIKDAESLSGKAGQAVEILLTGALAENVKNGAEGVAKFIDATDNAQSVDLPLTFPAFADRLEWSEPASMEFDHTGASAMPAIGYLLAMDGYVVRALEWVEEWSDYDTKFAGWVNVTYGETGEGLLKNPSVTFTVTENEGDTRCADIFVFPASLANTTVEDMYDPNTMAFKQEFKQYCKGRLTQKGAPEPFLVPISSPEAMAEVGTSFVELAEKDEANVLQWDYPGAPIYQKITYSQQWSYEEASFRITQPYAYYKLLADIDYPYGVFSKDVTDDENHWIKLWTNPDKTMGKFEMNSTPSSATHTAAIFYDENNAVVAAILIAFESNGGGSSSGATISSAMTGTEFETLDEYTAAPYVSNLGVPCLYLLSTNAYNTLIAKCSVPFATYSAFNTSLVPISFDITPMPDGQTFMIPGYAAETRAIVVLKDANGVNVAAFYYMAY